MLERIAEREASRSLPLPHEVFYHISLMEGFEEIVAEQVALLAHVGITKVKSFVIAERDRDIRRVIESAARIGVNIEVLGFSNDFRLGEGPTLGRIHNWAIENTKGSVTYLHTKGVSAPKDQHKKRWRRNMMRHIVAEYRHNLDVLRTTDIVCCAWQQDPRWPHACGNFWNSRCDWIASLLSPEDHRHSHPDFKWAGTSHSWRDRIYAETWIGSAPGHTVHDRVYFGATYWGEGVYQTDPGVPGFDYERDWCEIIGL